MTCGIYSGLSSRCTAIISAYQQYNAFIEYVQSSCRFLNLYRVREYLTIYMPVKVAKRATRAAAGRWPAWPSHRVGLPGRGDGVASTLADPRLVRVEQFRGRPPPALRVDARATAGHQCRGPPRQPTGLRRPSITWSGSACRPRGGSAPVARGNGPALTSARGSSRCSVRSRAEIRGCVSRWTDQVISCQSDES